MTSTLRSPNSAAPAPRGTVGTRVMALVGELMIVAGVVIGLFVVWQLFYTDVTAGRDQAKVLASLPWAQVNAIHAPAASGAPNAPDAPPATVAIKTIPASAQFDPSTAPTMKEPRHGTTFATMYVPRWGADYVKPISEGVTRYDILDKLGIGHYPGTGMPGALGNFAISAHRTTYAKPFSRIDELKVGDALVIQTKDAWYVYRVTGHEIVLPTQVEVIAPVPDHPGRTPNDHYITLTSCHPRFSASHRYVVHGVLVYWSPTGAGVPPEIVGGVTS